MHVRSHIRPATALVALAALLTAACGGGSEAAVQAEDCPLDALEAATGTVEVVAWHVEAAQQAATLEELVTEYNDSQDRVRVRLDSQGASYAELQRKFNQAMPSRQLPALMLGNDSFTQSMADSGVTLPGEACFEADDDVDLEMFSATARSHYSVDDVFWPASGGFANALLYYNRNHFRLAGLDPADPPGTLAEMRVAAEAIREAGVTDAPVVHEMRSWKTEYLLTGVGASVVDNDNGRGNGQTTAATLADNPAALEVFEWFEEMHGDGVLQAVPAVPGQIDQYIAMATQSASMLIETTDAATSIEAFLGGELDAAELPEAEDAADVDVDLSQIDLAAGPFPGLEDAGRTQVSGPAWFMLSTVPDEVQAAAWDFMRFMSSPPAQARMLVGGSYLPWVTAANEEPEAAAYYAGEGGIAGPWLEIANGQLESTDPDFPGPLIGPYDEFSEAMHEAHDQLVFAGASPQAALDRAQGQIDDALERYAEHDF
jgi:sn-glycerol 3-phosphate transport system substrate-binding protein